MREVALVPDVTHGTQSTPCAVGDEHGKFPRIALDPEVMGGKVCIRGLQVTVATVVRLLAAGRSADEILSAYPYLQPEDIVQCLTYAAWRLEEREVTLTLHRLMWILLVWNALLSCSTSS